MFKGREQHLQSRETSSRQVIKISMPASLTWWHVFFTKWQTRVVIMTILSSLLAPKVFFKTISVANIDAKVILTNMGFHYASNVFAETSERQYLKHTPADTQRNNVIMTSKGHEGWQQYQGFIFLPHPDMISGLWTWFPIIWVISVVFVQSSQERYYGRKRIDHGRPCGTEFTLVSFYSQKSLAIAHDFWNTNSLLWTPCDVSLLWGR